MLLPRNEVAFAARTTNAMVVRQLSDGVGVHNWLHELRWPSERPGAVCATG